MNDVRLVEWDLSTQELFPEPLGVTVLLFQ